MEPISKDRYYAECLIRHPELRKDLLAFHQQSPPLFQRTHQVGKALIDKALTVKEPRSWVTTRQRSQGTDCVVLVPEAFADIARLYSPFTVMELRVAGYGRQFLPQYGRRYYALMQISPSQWREAWKTLRRKWPKVPESFLRYGTLSEAYRPSLLVPNEPFSAKEWSEQLTRAAAGTRSMIPVYSETTFEDIERCWRDVQHRKDWVYRDSERRTRRERPGQYAKRLQVWDAVQEYGPFAKAARHLKMKESTLKGVYMTVARGILGKLDLRNPRQRVLADFDPKKHENCPTCQAAQDPKEMCYQARAYVSQDEGSLLGRLSSTLDQLPDTPS